MMRPLFLLLSLGIASALLPDDFLVKGLESAEPAFDLFQGKMYSGLLSAIPDGSSNRKESKSLMFWLFDPNTPTSLDSMVIWLNGGPGCSSFNGALAENGPVTIPSIPAGTLHSQENPGLVPNKYAWTNAAPMLYVENPVGVGFSSGGPPPSNEEDLSTDFYYFLQNFYDLFPKLRPKKLFLFGESYAGMYVPSIAHKISNRNKENQSATINLAGIGLGNGWIDAMVQGPTIIDYAWFHGLIDKATKDSLHAEWQTCSHELSQPQPPPFHQFNVPDECGMLDAIQSASGGISMYDVTSLDLYPVFMSKNGTIPRFFNDPLVREALNVPQEKEEWATCIPGAGRRRRLALLDHDTPASMLPYIAKLLDDTGIKVLVYNGDRDLSCCAQGTELALDQMDWSGAGQWRSNLTRRHVWKVDGEVAGYAKFYKGLEFVVVYNSGHLVPLNQPRFALDLITRFLTNEHFTDVPLPTVDIASTQQSNNENEKEELHLQKGGASNSSITLIAASCGFVAGIGCTLAFTVFFWKGTRGKRHDYNNII